MATSEKKVTKICICALDTQFVHASPVPWALKAAYEVFGAPNRSAINGASNGANRSASNGATGSAIQIDVCELSINDLCEDVVRSIMQKQPDAVAFSCYLWNINMVKRVVSDIKRINPEVIVVLGGPEVTYDGEGIFERIPQADVVICGEGECSFPRVCREIAEGKIKSLKNAESGNHIIVNDFDISFWENREYQLKLAELMIPNLENKIGYIETSRGCPFSCIYCLASAGIRKVRNLDLQLVKELLKMYSQCEVRQIKFVDRTFNVDAKRACEILKIILELYNESCCADNQDEYRPFPMSWHFEVAADLFTDEMLEIISDAPQGLFQFEIGLQSLNEDVLSVVCRKTNCEKVLSNIRRLLACKKCMIHTDLIAGLPGENLASFIDGFNQLHSLYPHELQLGFLKCLKGAAINNVNAEYGMVYSEYAPYEVLRTNHLSWDEICMLKRIESGVELLWNSGRFCETVKELCEMHYGGKAFDLYLDFANLMGDLEGAIGVDKLNQLMQQLLEKNSANDSLWETYIKDIRCFGFSGKLPKQVEEMCSSEKIPFAQMMDFAAEKFALTQEERANMKKTVKLWRLPNNKILAVNMSRKNILSNCYMSAVLE